MNNQDTQQEELVPTTDATGEIIIDEAITEVNKIPVGRQLVLLAVILLLIFGTTITPKILALTQKADTGAATVELHNKKTLNAASVEVADTAFSDVTITDPLWMNLEKIAFAVNLIHSACAALLDWNHTPIAIPTLIASSGFSSFSTAFSSSFLAKIFLSTQDTFSKNTSRKLFSDLNE